MGLNGRPLVMSGKEVLVDSQGKFAQGIHRLVGIFGEEAAIIFRKSHDHNQCIDSIFQCSRASSINFWHKHSGWRYNSWSHGCDVHESPWPAQ